MDRIAPQRPVEMPEITPELEQELQSTGPLQWWLDLQDQFGVPQEWRPALEQSVGVILTLASVAVLALLLRQLRLLVVKKVVRRSKAQWDDVLADARLFRWVTWIPATLAGYAVIRWLDQQTAGDPRLGYQITANFLKGATGFAGMMALGALLTAANRLWEARKESARHPIKGYVTLGKIAVYVVGGIWSVALLFGRDPTGVLAGIGAMTAVLLLIFKDTILSFVAALQLTSQDMVRLGDWIEVPGANADGDVIDISLHTVTVRNWDRTITTIPTTRLVSGSFKNWRTMSEGPGRRIKRHLLIDASSVRFLGEEEIQRMRRVDLISDYMAGKAKDLEATNNGRAGDDEGSPTNLRRLTNLGTFRAYAEKWLRNQEPLNQDLTFLVRQLQPTPQGIPLEFYLFTKTTAWGDYEAIQADLMDHLLAVLREFDLRVHQAPGAAHFHTLLERDPDAAGHLAG